jgi:hypothetical protein
VAQRACSVRRPKLSDQADAALDQDAPKTSDGTETGVVWKPLQRKGIGSTPGGTRTPNLLIGRSPRGVYECRSGLELRASESPDVHDRPLGSTENGSQLGFQRRRMGQVLILCSYGLRSVLCSSLRPSVNAGRGGSVPWLAEWVVAVHFVAATRRLPTSQLVYRMLHAVIREGHPRPIPGTGPARRVPRFSRVGSLLQ